MNKGKPDLLHGTLELLILKTLGLGDLHGWAISKHIQRLSDDVLAVGQGSLYPALYRLEDRGWIKARWGVAETGRRAKFYALTKQGRKQFDMEEAHWNAFHTAVNKVLATE
ncbi:MAG: PadR family transcriptional regulator [Gemmatimonadota bacterium]|jgi:transcriptional regulator